MFQKVFLTYTWEDKPKDLKSKTCVWRYSENPVIPRDLLPYSNSIFNSAVVPFNGEFRGVPAEGWQNSITKYRTSVDYLNDGSPKWNWQDIIILKPGNKFAEAVKDGMDKMLLPDEMWAEYALSYSKLISESAKDPEKRQKGWMTRIHPCTLKSGRILLPLYSDGFNTALVAISDDTGKTWKASKPMVGTAGIQPSIVQKKDGTLVAYLRDSGINYKILKSTSKDDGETWSLALPTDIPDPGVSVEVISLNDGAWIMIHNEGIDGRSSLVALLSDDEGKTWNWKRPIVKVEPGKGSFSYPSIIQTDDGLLHLTYSYNVNEEKTIKYVVFNTDWVKQGNNNLTA